MSPLLQQFISESREQLQGISEALLGLEKGGDIAEGLNELFRLVHTLKGSSGLFDFPDMTRVLHAGEDLLTELRDLPELFTHDLNDTLFDCMDFVSQQLDDLESKGEPGDDKERADQLEAALRHLLDNLNQPSGETAATENTNELADSEATVTAAVDSTDNAAPPATPGTTDQQTVSASAIDLTELLARIPELARDQALADAMSGVDVMLIHYQPEDSCFFSGEDPFYQVRQCPGWLWGCIQSVEPLASVEELDPFQCQLQFWALTSAGQSDVEEHFRYNPEALTVHRVEPEQLIFIDPDLPDFRLDSLVMDKLHDSYASRDTSSLMTLINKQLDSEAEDNKSYSALRWIRQIASAANDSPLLEACWKMLAELHDYQPPQVCDLQSKPVETVADLPPELDDVLATQRHILDLDDTSPWAAGRMQALGNTLMNAMQSVGLTQQQETARGHLQTAMDKGDKAPMTDWLDNLLDGDLQPANEAAATALAADDSADTSGQADTSPSLSTAKPAATAEPAATTGMSVEADTVTIKAEPASQAEQSAAAEPAPKALVETNATSAPPAPAAKQASAASEVTESSPQVTSRSLKVDQEKIDRLMSLIGEMVVAKNSLPFLAQKAEKLDVEDQQYGSRDLSRELKEQYGVINRIAEEMQDAIMQIRMMPFSFISMRFPRLVRDISRRLGKDIQLAIEGEDTEADKNIIESLAEPLIHIVRNSLDHGIEMPDVRKAAGKPAAGKLNIRATQEADRVLIEIADDGKGINPEVVKRKAIEKGLIDEATAERMTDREAVNLVMAPGFSTAEAVSDLSGRGVGMDAVRRAVDKVNGTLALDSEPGKGTRIRIQLPMSIAVTRVMMIETDGQLMGIPMDQVLETVRVHSDSIHELKQSKTTILRNRIIPLKSLNFLLNLESEPMLNEDGEYAVLVIRVGAETVGLMVDNFRGSADIIQKPLTGSVLGGVSAYSGAALVGDGSVLMVLNPRELI